jgi:ribosome-binding factor A
VTSDLQHATVYYTVLGDTAAQEGARDVLEAKKGILRRELGRNLTIRLTPTLEFVADEVPVNASHVEDLLRQARARDEELARLAASAQPAGDADPYRKPEARAEDGGDELDGPEHESEFDGVEIDAEEE